MSTKTKAADAVGLEEQLILVDENDNILGYRGKSLCHARSGLLHRAFSVFIFNQESELLLQRRSKKKLLWPLYWSNSVCSHPRKGETYETAVARRLREELGIECPLQSLFKFRYQANYKTVGAENELCTVYFGRSRSSLSISKDEIADVKYVSIDRLKDELKVNSDAYTPWLKIEWDHILNHHLPQIENAFTNDNKTDFPCPTPVK